ncbi:MAG TPA: succinate dehydrogenase, cytochrome b556 subunit [Gammaproteobacteria bacterium]|nr:succinate dehydrogenase, cytochrome b556 subunit [Gammaproteobacteria bacterium]
MQGVQRPLSPHLQVYRWGITMWLSSLHRITGLLLSAGAFMLAVWLIAIAGGPQSYAAVQQVFASGAFKVLLVGWTFCFFLHLANGVRHLAWDVGAGFGQKTIRSSGWTVIVVAVLATAGFSWLAIL